MSTHVKPLLVVLVGVGALVVGASTVAIAAMQTTPNDVKTLTTAESKVVSVLHSYKDTAAWKAEFKAAVAVQNTDLTRADAALGIGASPPVPTVLFSLSGSGVESTTSFAVPASDSGWHVNWTYNCASFGTTGNFDFYVYKGTALDFTDNGPNQLGANGKGTEHFYDSGTFHLEVDSECDWTVQALPGS